MFYCTELWREHPLSHMAFSLLYKPQLEWMIWIYYTMPWLCCWDFFFFFNGATHVSRTHIAYKLAEPQVLGWDPVNPKLIWPQAQKSQKQWLISLYHPLTYHTTSTSFVTTQSIVPSHMMIKLKKWMNAWMKKENKWKRGLVKTWWAHFNVQDWEKKYPHSIYRYYYFPWGLASSSYCEFLL